MTRGDLHDASVVPQHKERAPEEEPAQGAPDTLGIPVSSVGALSGATALGASSRLVSVLSCSVALCQMAMSRCRRAGPSEPSDLMPECWVLALVAQGAAGEEPSKDLRPHGGGRQSRQRTMKKKLPLSAHDVKSHDKLIARQDGLMGHQVS